MPNAEAARSFATDSSVAPLLKSGRLVSVDVLRGIVLVVMALDHARDYFTNVHFPPEDLARTWGALFFTRWITHICAPVFFFLAGTSAYLSKAHGKSNSQISRFLWTRGLWLVVMEFTIVGYAWAFVYPFGLGQTIWALGWSMVVLAALVHLPVRWIGTIGVGMIALHNLTDLLAPAQFGQLSWLWTILHVPDWAIPNKLAILYPLIPWIGVMAAGYAFGAVLEFPSKRRRRVMLLLGVCVTLAFLILRGTNLYGNPHDGSPGQFRAHNSDGPWHVQKTTSMTVIAFLNVEKYPPSLQFLLMTLGPSFLLLAALDRGALVASGSGRVMRFFLTYGRVPMMFYVAHIFLVHALAVLVAWLFHQPAWWLLHGAWFLNSIPAGYGHDLPFVYFVWITVTLALYVPCHLYAGVKARRKDWWLSYL